MSNNPREYNISNENLLLISILNSMYNDNIRQINNLSESIHLLNDTNSEIRNLLTQILYTNTNRRNQFYRPKSSRVNSFREHITAPTHMRSDVRRVTANTGFHYLDDFLTNGNHSGNGNNRVHRNRNEGIDINRTNVNAHRNTNVSQFWQNFFQPIAIFPTQTQIESATRTVQYGDIVSPINRACPISLENFNDADIVTIIRFCGHIFNRDELSTWFRTNCRCPVCRYDIRNYQPNNSTELYAINNITQHSDNTRENNEVIDESEDTDDTTHIDDTSHIDNNPDTPETNNIINQSVTSIRDGNPVNSSIIFDIYFDNNVFRDISGNFATNNTNDISLLQSLLNNVMNNSTFR